MDKITVRIDGMICGMCEAHICDTIRRVFPDAKKVKASRKDGEATFLSGDEINADALNRAIEATGYSLVSVSAEPYKKRGLLGK